MEAIHEGFSVNGYEKRNLLSLDKICSEYDATWSSNHSLADFRSFLFRNSRPTSPDFIELFCELAQIDIERRWRQFGDSANRFSLNEPLPTLGSLWELPRFDRYLDMIDLNHRDSTSMVPKVLAKCEFRARCQYGDVPHPSEYGLVGESRELEKFLPLVAIASPAGTIYESSFFSPLEIGRQGVDEPESIQLWRIGSKSKLICAILNNKSISRRQLRISVVGGKRIQIENLSENRGFLVGPETCVAPQSQIWLHLPAIVDLDSLTIRIRRPLFE